MPPDARPRRHGAARSGGPRCPGTDSARAGELLVDVERVGICGTDVELYTGEMAYLAQGDHALSDSARARVDRTRRRGRRPRRRGAGSVERITGDTMLGCGHCEYCLAGDHHVCPTRFEVGIRDGWAGALAEQVLIPTRFAYAIPETVSVTAAALVEPGGNSLRAVRAAALEPGQRVLVLGSGTIGLLAAQFALAAGAEVHVGGVREGSLALARSLGVPHTWHLDRARRLGARPRSTRSSTPPASTRMPAPRGAAGEAGRAGRLHRALRRPRASSTAATSRSRTSPRSASCPHRRDSPGAIEAFASGAVVPDAIVSEVIALDDVPVAPRRHSGVRMPARVPRSTSTPASGALRASRAQGWTCEPTPLSRRSDCITWKVVV